MRLYTFIKGVSIGFILGVLFAPDKGRATRRKIANIASDIQDDMADSYNSLGNAIKEKVQEIKSNVRDITHKAEEELTADEY